MMTPKALAWAKFNAFVLLVAAALLLVVVLSPTPDQFKAGCANLLFCVIFGRWLWVVFRSGDRFPARVKVFARLFVTLLALIVAGFVAAWLCPVQSLKVPL